MLITELKNVILSDLYRYESTTKYSALIKQVFGGEAFKYIFWMRLCKYFSEKNTHRILFLPISVLILRHYKYKFGISIPHSTNISAGLYIGHIGNITINSEVVIGKNCNIHQCTTIGQSNRGINKGYPIIGDNVYIGPGAVIIGSINIGSNVAIGANCVVTKSVPNNSVVVGIPGKVISDKGSIGYINNKINIS